MTFLNSPLDIKIFKAEDEYRETTSEKNISVKEIENENNTHTHTQNSKNIGKTKRQTTRNSTETD